LLFSTQKEISDGSFFDTVGVYYSFLGTKEKIIDYKEMSLRGIHNAQNSMAAICVAKAYGLDSDLIRDSLKTFPGVEHRLELVRTIDGIKFINDSKATNVDSVYWALQSFEEPIILIMGGKDKGNNYDAIRDLVQNRVKKIFAIGSSANKIFNYFHKIVKVEIKESLEECVKAAFMEARNNDVILLSPACASFDMFENFEHRGKVFKDAVMSL
jgi:UDP-N-acetylmuramoylalanine--D-glutamate ligase